MNLNYSKGQQKLVAKAKTRKIAEMAEAGWVEVTKDKWMNPITGRIWSTQMAIEIRDMQRQGRSWRGALVAGLSKRGRALARKLKRKNK